MREFKITSRDGVDLGTYKARNKKAALDAMAKDAGYKSQADAVKNGIAPFDGTVVEIK